MRKIYILLIFCLLILSIFTSCDEPNQPQAITITLDSGVLEEKATTISTVENKKVTLPSGETIWKTDKYSFSGWATTKDGEASYKAETSFSSSSDVTLFAVWKEHDLLYTLNEDANSYSVKAANTSISGSITILSIYNEKNVTAIADYAFADCKDVTSVIIPDTVTSIGLGAFFRSGITSIEIPDSVTTTGGAVFSKCSSLESVKLSANMTELKAGNINTETYSSVGSGFFLECSKLKTVENLDKITTIGERAFYKCSSFESLKLTTATTSIGKNAFYGCTSLEEATIPGLTSIEYGLFDKCKSLKTIDIPNSVTSIGMAAFSSSGLTSIDIPSGVTSIGDNAFDGCKNLKTISIPDSVVAIGSFVFNSCSSLSKITIPSGITTVALVAFGYCEGLTEITIPGTILSIDPDAFYGCSNLKSIYIDMDENNALDTKNNKWGAEGATVIWKNYYSISSDGVLERVTGAEDKFTGAVVIPSKIGGITVTAIANNGLIGCDFTSVTLPETVKSIGINGFKDCKKLTSIIVPNSVTSMGCGVFAGCEKLEAVTLSENTTVIGDNSFGGCTALESIVIPSSVETISENAFSQCTSLKTITINKAENSITGSPWGADTKITNIKWGD